MAEDFFDGMKSHTSVLGEDTVKNDNEKDAKEKIKQDLSPASDPTNEVSEEKEEDWKSKFVETNRYSRAKSQKLAAIRKGLESIVSSDEITKDDLANILDIVNSGNDNWKEPVEHGPGEDLSSIDKIYRTIRQDDIQNYVDLTGGDDFEKKSIAFNTFFSELTEEEKSDTIKEMENYINRPIALLRFIQEKGQKFLEDTVYGDFLDSGGFKGFSSKQQSKIEQLNREIDTLKKKLLQYEDFKKSGKFKIGDSSSAQKFQEENTKDFFAGMKLKR